MRLQDLNENCKTYLSTNRERRSMMEACVVVVAAMSSDFPSSYRPKPREIAKVIINMNSVILILFGWLKK